MADRLYITEVDTAPEGDVYFPALDDDEWDETQLETHAADGQNDHAFIVNRLDRKA